MCLIDLRVAFVDGLTSQNVMPVDGEGLPGKALKKKWCLSLFLKAGRVEMDEGWPGSLFQIYEATDENDLDFAMGFSGRNTYWQRRRRSWSCWHIPWNKGGEIGWLLELQNLESDNSNLEIYSLANRKPMQIRKNGRDVTKRDFSVTTRASVFWTSCRRAKFETDVPARRELQ